VTSLQNLLLGRVLLGGLAATGAGSLDKLGSDSKPQPTDLPAASACLDFNRAVGDVHQGVVTDLQTNGQLQKVFEQGRRAETPVARDTFYECQRARLSGDPVAFKRRQDDGALPYGRVAPLTEEKMVYQVTCDQCREVKYPDLPKRPATYVCNRCRSGGTSPGGLRTTPRRSSACAASRAGRG